MKHFVLVHGACHGAWCWYKLVTLLKQAGHRVTALDLGGCGVHPKPLHEIRTLDDYVDPLITFMGSLDIHDGGGGGGDQKVILVGHSYGGIAISLAMEKYPERIDVAVFVSAYMPSTSSPPITLVHETYRRTPKEQFLDTTFYFDEGHENGSTAVLFDPILLATKLYQLCPLEDLELGKLLVKPEKVLNEELEKEGMFSEERYGKVNRVFVMCEEDELMKKDFQQWIIDTSPPTQVLSIPNADHMPMLSTPQHLSHFLFSIALNY